MTDFIWGNLLHLSYNMWPDRNGPGMPKFWGYFERMHFDDGLWRELTQAMADAGMNLVVIDLGDAVRYDSHPEIALPDAWSRDRLQAELGRLRELGLEPIPKLNFSTGHDTWLKDYGRMVSTPVYYTVCQDLIREVCVLFDRPRFFHLGMDEETAGNQTHFDLVVVRQHDLYWHDFQFLVEAVESQGVRAWIWSDMVWDHEQAWLAHMPKTVLQSNWYYGTDFDLSADGDDRDKAGPATYGLLDRHGFDQIPTGSVWSEDSNMALTIAHCRKVIAPERLKGFLMAPWYPTIQACRAEHLRAIAIMGEAIRACTTTP